MRRLGLNLLCVVFTLALHACSGPQVPNPFQTVAEVIADALDPDGSGGDAGKDEDTDSPDAGGEDDAGSDADGGSETDDGSSDDGSGGSDTGGGSGEDSGSDAGDSSGDGSDGNSDSGSGTKGFVHPGLLHTAADFARIKAKVDAGEQPWVAGFARLTSNARSSATYSPSPVSVVYRGDIGYGQNFSNLFKDAAAAYALAIRWKVTGDTAYADRAIFVLNAWADTLTKIDGTSDKYLAAGLYGYQLANAAEIMRTYDGWSEAQFSKFKEMMLTIFYPMNSDFLKYHNGRKIDHYWANWDLCNIASMISIGVLTDRQDIYDEAVDYFLNGGGNGALKNAIWYIHDNGMGQVQESGRDQAHSLLVVGLLATIAQTAWNQGLDLYGYDNNRILAGAEYVAAYNLGNDVPFQPYSNSSFSTPTVSADKRGEVRPIWEMIYNHYVVRQGLSAPYVQQYAETVRVEGGGGHYGPNSGGYDQLGYGTLMYTLGQ